MNFRTTSFSMSQQAIDYAAKYNANISKYQKQISSGLRIHRPSDDPIAFRQISSLSARLTELSTEGGSILVATAKLNAGVSQLTEANGLLVRGKLIAQQGVQSLSDSERAALAIEVDGLLSSLKNITGTKTAGAFMFGGAKTDVHPFEFGDPLVEGGTLTVDYRGSEFNSRSFISEAVSIDTLFAGDDIFGNSQRGETILHGSTGAARGSGTDNLIGRATLQVRHTSTTYLGGSGVVAGASSADGDTIIGQAGKHTLTINDTSGTGASGTVSLNGGNSVAFASTDTNLELTGPNGGKIFIDLSAITPGFNGTVDIASDGTLSVDGGMTTTAIDFSGNQTIVDSTSDRFANIDSTGITTVGDEYLDFPGTSDAFQILFELSEDLRNTRGLSNTELAESLDSRIGELDRMSDHILSVVGNQSASLQTLERLEFRNQDLALETEYQLHELQATNIPEAVLRFENDQSLLQYTYAITAQINSIGIIDFLR